MAPPRKLTSSSDYVEMLSRYDIWLFDCGGMLWSGDDAIAGARETIDMLRGLGNRVLFVTNNASRSRKSFKKRFDKLGIKASEVRSGKWLLFSYADKFMMTNSMRLCRVHSQQQSISRMCSSSLQTVKCTS